MYISHWYFLGSKCLFSAVFTSEQSFLANKIHNLSDGFVALRLIEAVLQLSSDAILWLNGYLHWEPYIAVLLCIKHHPHHPTPCVNLDLVGFLEERRKPQSSMSTTLRRFIPGTICPRFPKALSGSTCQNRTLHHLATPSPVIFTLKFSLLFMCVKG